MYFSDQALNSEDNMFSLSTSKRPDSERLLYSSACASTRRPPTAPLSPENLDSNFAEKPALASLLDGEWTADTRLSHIMSYLQDATPQWRDVDPFTPVIHATMRNGLTPLPMVYSQAREWPLQQRFDDSSSRQRTAANNTPPQPKAPAKGWWKTEICKFWKENGGCRNEGNCRWAHGEHELRKLEITTPDHPFVPQTARSEPLELWTSWVTVNWAQSAKIRRGALFRSLWESVRGKNQAVAHLEENLFIATSGLKLGADYWNAVAELFTAPKGNTSSCDLCAEESNTVSNITMSTPHLALTVCTTCNQIVDTKSNIISLVPAGSPGIPPNNDRRKLIYWGMTLLAFMKHLDEPAWNANGLDITADNVPTTYWTRHRCILARGAALMKRYLEGLAMSRRVRLLTTELLPALSLLDWSAAACQPVLFIAMLICGFPLPESSVADTVLTNLVPFSPRKPATILSTGNKRKTKINNSPSAETATSPSPPSPFESEEGLIE